MHNLEEIKKYAEEKKIISKDIEKLLAITEVNENNEVSDIKYLDCILAIDHLAHCRESIKSKLEFSKVLREEIKRKKSQ